MIAAAPGYVRRETAISIVINMVLSAAFFGAVFGGHAMVPIWGKGGLAFDNAVQGFMVALMGGLVPALLTRKRHGQMTMLGPIFTRSLVTAIFAALIFGGGAAILLTLTGAVQLPFAPVMVAKILCGGVIALIVTPAAVRRILAS